MRAPHASVAAAEAAIADAADPDPPASGRNDTGEIPSENVGEPRKLTRFALTHLPVRAIDAGGDDIDHDLAGCRHGIRHLAELQNFRSAVPFDEGFFLCCSSLCLDHGGTFAGRIQFV